MFLQVYLQSLNVSPDIAGGTISAELRGVFDTLSALLHNGTVKTVNRPEFLNTCELRSSFNHRENFLLLIKLTVGIL